jgi:antitoxin ParD1/3/4
MTMPNTTLNLSIPAELKEKALEQARERHFSSTSDYLQHLIRTDIELAEQKKKLSDFLQMGLDSGEAQDMTLEEFGGWMTRVIKEAR